MDNHTAFLTSMQGLRDNLHSRVEALGREVSRLRSRAEDLERGMSAEDEDGDGIGEQGEERQATDRDGMLSQPSRRWLLPLSTTTFTNSSSRLVTRVPADETTTKSGSGLAEMYGTAEERRAARLAAAITRPTRAGPPRSASTTQTERDHHTPSSSHASSSTLTQSRAHEESIPPFRPRANTNDSDQTIMSLPLPLPRPTTQPRPTSIETEPSRARRTRDANTAATSRASEVSARAALFAEPFEYDRMTSRGRVVVDRERTAARDSRDARLGGSRTPTPTMPSAVATPSAAAALAVVREALRERRAAAATASTTNNASTTDRPWRNFANSPSGGITTFTETIASRRRNSPSGGGGGGGGGGDIPTLNERTPLFLPISGATSGRQRGSTIVPLDQDEYPTLIEATRERVREMAEEAEVFTAATMEDQLRLPAPASRSSVRNRNTRLETPRLIPSVTTTMSTSTPASDTSRTPDTPTPISSSTINATTTTTDASFTPRAIAELRALQNTVTRLNDRLEVARGNMAMLALARSSLRSRDERQGITGGEGPRLLIRATSPDVSREDASSSPPPPPHQQLARRPSFPYNRSVHHPHMRPRLSPLPIAFVLNIDNVNSFDVNFDGTIVFRPSSAREPDRELVARCLSMLPGGRDGTQSRWMRLTGNGTSRPRRAGASAGFWVRWVSEAEPASTGIRHRAVDMTLLPRIIGFDFATSPPDDDAFVRADEIEFTTPRTRLRAHLGPWMHSRVRIEAFETDARPAPWGTSAHVRQSAQGLGSLTAGNFMRYQIRERRAELYPRNSTLAVAAGTATTRLGDVSASASRIGLERVLDSYESLGMTITSDSVLAIGSTHQPSSQLTSGATSDPESAWLMSFEPATGQIRASWRAHFRRTRDDAPLLGSATLSDTRSAGSRQPSRRIARNDPGSSATDQSTDSSVPRSTSHELWSREYLDENGVPHPALPVNELVQSVRQEEWQNELARRLSETGSREGSRTPSQGTPPHINYV